MLFFLLLRLTFMWAPASLRYPDLHPCIITLVIKELLLRHDVWEVISLLQLQGYDLRRLLWSELTIHQVTCMILMKNGTMG